jgi:PilZ domain
LVLPLHGDIRVEHRIYLMRLQTMVAIAPTTLDHPGDQRQDQRHQLNQAATVSVFGTNEVLQGEIRNISEGGTQIRLDQPLRCASLVEIQYNDNSLLGEVIYCAQEQAGWLVGVRVEHALLGLSALASIAGRD